MRFSRKLPVAALLTTLSAVFLFGCGSTEVVEVVKEVPVQVETIKEVVVEKEVPVEVQVIKEVEVIKEIKVEGAERVIEKEVIKEVGRGGTLTVATAEVGPPTNFPGDQTGGVEAISTFFGIQERLIERQQNLTYIPRLLTAYEVSSDLTTLTGKVRKGVQFHQGLGDLTAEDIKFSYGHAGLENPDSINGSVGYLHNYLNPLKVDGDDIVFPMKLCSANPGCGFLGMTNITSHQTTAKDHVIGTGPFEVTKFVADNTIEANSFQNYWDGPASFDKLVVKEVPEASTRVAMIKTGEVGIIDSVSLSYMDDLMSYGIIPNAENRSGVNQAIYMGGNYWQDKYHDRDEPVTPRPGFKPDADHPWIGDRSDAAQFEKARRVRWAMSQAIDRKLIAEEVTLGLGRAEYIPWFSTELPEYKSEWTIPYDPDTAVKELEATGYGDGFLVTIFLPPDRSSLNYEIYEAALTMWANIGLEVKIDATAYTSFRPKLVERKLEYLYAHSGGNELNDFNLPRGAVAEWSTWSEGDWNTGIEAIEFFTAYDIVESNPTNKKAQIAANTEMAQFMFDTQVALGTVKSPNPLYYNPTIVTRWTLLPGANMNNLHTVTLR